MCMYGFHIYLLGCRLLSYNTSYKRPCCLHEFFHKSIVIGFSSVFQSKLLHKCWSLNFGFLLPGMCNLIVKTDISHGYKCRFIMFIQVCLLFDCV